MFSEKFPNSHINLIHIDHKICSVITQAEVAKYLLIIGAVTPELSVRRE